MGETPQIVKEGPCNPSYKTTLVLYPWAHYAFFNSVGFFSWFKRRGILMKPTKEYITFESLPDILEAKHIAQYLRISRRRVYELCHLSPKHGGIPNFSIGASIRVEKEDFNQWVEQKKK
jgi:excisionase family DNA binding protein